MYANDGWDEEFQSKHQPLYSDVYCGFNPPVGWRGIIEKLTEQLERICEESGETFTCVQVKEKFGTLRFYTSGIPESIYDRVRAAINDAELASSMTCEDCGAPGKLRDGGWLQTLCDEHSKGRPLYSSR